MKKVLIVGKNSYIGESFKNWLCQWPEDYSVNAVGTLDNQWSSISFCGYDIVVHVAGIAHVKETKKNEDLIFKINCDLATTVAEKAKKEGVKQFIFLSTMSVYGMDYGVITKETITDPKTNYGKSKLKAEKNIIEKADTSFRVSVIRPPMVYGKGCKGNYQTLKKFSERVLFFPLLDNSRSMIYIDNLCEFLKFVIDYNLTGTLFPQNKEYVCTKSMVKLISEYVGRKIIFVSFFNWLINKLIGKSKLITKIFGTLIYQKELSMFEMFNYNVCEYTESVKRTVDIKY